MLTVTLIGAGVIGGGAAAPQAAAGIAECAPDTAAKVKPGSNVTEPGALTRTERAAAERRTAERMRAKKLSARSLMILPRVTVDVYAHILRPTNGVGGATRRQVERQINVLNQAFAGRVNAASVTTLFRFRLKEITETNNSDWYAWSTSSGDPNGSDDVAAKRALHRGGYDDLNVYVAGLENDLLGYAYFPGAAPVWQDGVVLLDEGLPGGDEAPYNLGDTATHEVGHWLGLHHTFDNGCVAPGDEVADTPYQLDDSRSREGKVYDCKPTLDTCSHLPGRDPVRNFMNYTPDACMDRFTAGQAQRMALQWYTYRNSAPIQ